MRISLIICTYNRINHLPYCLNSILSQNVSSDHFEVVIIDNNSTDGTAEYVSEFIIHNKSTNIILEFERNQGLSHARNKGAKIASTPYVAYIDDDAIIKEDYVQNCISFIDNNPKVPAFGGPIFVHFESSPPSWENKYINSMFGYFNPSDQAFIFDKTNYPRGSNMIFKTELFQEVGYFNTELGRVKRGLIGNEEKDIFHRIYNTYSNVHYRPELIVHHIAPDSRTTKSFVRRQAIGTGMGERRRTRYEGGFAFVKRLFQELYKWAGTIVLCALYLLKGQHAKSIVLIQFRFWITSGFLGWSVVE